MIGIDIKGGIIRLKELTVALHLIAAVVRATSARELIQDMTFVYNLLQVVPEKLAAFPRLQDFRNSN